MSAAREPDIRWLTGAQLGLVLSMVSDDLKLWRDKKLLLTHLGRDERERRVSEWRLAGETGLHVHRVSELIKELREERIVLALEERAGNRAALLGINPAIATWGVGRPEHQRVPWRRDVAAVIGLVRDPDSCTAPRLRAVTPRSAPDLRAHGTDCAREQVPLPASRRAQRRRARGNLRLTSTPPRATETTARADHAPDQGPPRAQTEPVALEGVLSLDAGLHAAGTEQQQQQTEAQQQFEVEFRRARSVLTRAGKPGKDGHAFLARGRDEERFRRVLADVGADRVIELLQSSPKRLIVPHLLDWLEDQAHLPTAVAEALDARPEDEPGDEAPELVDDGTVARLPEFVPRVDEEVADPDAVAAAALEARAHLRRRLSEAGGMMEAGGDT